MIKRELFYSEMILVLDLLALVSIVYPPPREFNRRILGHSSVEVTQKRYAFLNDQFLKEEMSKFEITANFSTVSAPQNIEVLKIREKSVC